MIKKLLWLVLVINIVYVVMGVAKYGCQHVDAYGIWMLKARAWTRGTEALQNVLKNEKFGYSHQQYPLLLPAMMTGWARLFGTVESFVWVYPLVYVAVLVALYRLTGSLGWTTAATFMGPLMAQGGRLHAGLADIWICLLVGLGLLAIKHRSLAWLTIIVMVASQMKTEGIFLMALFTGMPGSWSKKIGWMILAAIPFMWWQWQVRVWGLPSDIGFYWPGVGELARRVPLIIELVIKEMLNWQNWYVVWIIWWVTLLSARGGFSPLKRESLRILGLMGLGYVGVYLFSSLDPVRYVSSSIDRVMLQLLPVWWPMLGWKNDNYRDQ